MCKSSAEEDWQDQSKAQLFLRVFVKYIIYGIQVFWMNNFQNSKSSLVYDYY